MDFKTTVLTEAVVVNEARCPEIEPLLFGKIAAGRDVFDYTAYFINTETDEVNYKVFMRSNQHFIKSLAGSANIPLNSIFFINTDGHVLVAAELAWLFLAFVNPSLCTYFHRLLTDALLEGIAISHGLIYGLAMERLPNGVLKEIINIRGDEQTDSE